MRTEEITIYKFDELSAEAKETARDWWRDCERSEFDAEYVIEDFQRICAILGVTLGTRPVKLYGGGTRHEPTVWWSGFSCQGDGASWEGRYAYAKGAAKAIRDYAPTDTELHEIADAFQRLQSVAFYQLTASVSQSGRYVHEMTMSAEVSRGERYADDSDADALLGLFRDLARWLYRALEREYEWRMSDEQIDESIIANEYEFEADGSRH